MTAQPTISTSVRRALARDDLIMIAADVDKAVGIVHQREALPRRSQDEKSLFSVALQHYLRVAEDETEEWALRAQAWKHAGVIVRFGDLVGIPAEQPKGRHYSAAELHELSLRQLDDETDGVVDAEPLSLPLYELNRYRAARELRLAGRLHEALKLSMVTNEALNASGVEPHTAHLTYEAGAAYISCGQAGQVDGMLQEKEAYFIATRAAGYPTRYRFNFVRALGHWEVGDNRAAEGLRTALSLARRNIRGHRVIKDPNEAGLINEGSLDLLSVLLSAAEYLTAHGQSAQDRDDALNFGREALTIANHARGRWRVIARSRAPLAVVFQRIYGDIALLADAMAAPEAARLGLRVALSAKQTGFAARMRTGHTLMSPEVQRIIQNIVHVEDGPRAGAPSAGPTGETSSEQLKRLRFELEEAVSPMLADTVLPPPAKLEDLTRIINSRYALDYLQLTDSLADRYLFRSLIRPGDRISFARFEPDPYYARFFSHAGERGNLATLIGRTHAGSTREIPTASALSGKDLDVVGKPGAFDWKSLADHLLPAELREDLADADGSPIELIVSAHSWLSLVPWPALQIGTGDGQVPLVRRAIITQTPALTCLHHERPPQIDGRALVHLVGKDNDGVDVSAERVAWGLAASTDGIPLSACDVASDQPPKPLRTLADAIGRWGFAHFAAHGEGRGLDQRLVFPGESLSFGHALTLAWPGSVLMASCHVGLVLNVTEAEPLNLIMGLLSGGARCVVAGVASVDDEATGVAASHIVRAVRSEAISLDVALREAQLAAVRAGRPEEKWALLAAYTQ